MRKQFSIAPLRQVLEHCRELGLSVMYTFMGEERTEFLSDWCFAKEKKEEGLIRPSPLPKRNGPV